PRPDVDSPSLLPLAPSNGRPHDSEPGRPRGVAPQPRAEESFPTLELIRRLVAQRLELPVVAVSDRHRLLGDLHLNSIAVGQLVSDACRHLGRSMPLAPTQFADATVSEVALALDGLEVTPDSTLLDAETTAPAGIESWVRTFAVALVDRPRGRARL